MNTQVEQDCGDCSFWPPDYFVAALRIWCKFWALGLLRNPEATSIDRFCFAVVSHIQNLISLIHIIVTLTLVKKQKIFYWPTL